MWGQGASEKGKIKEDEGWVRCKEKCGGKWGSSNQRRKVMQERKCRVNCCETWS